MNNSAISALPGAVCQWLAEQDHLVDMGLEFLTEFPARSKAVPLRRPIVAVGMSAVNITDKFEENDNGVLERQEYCRTASLRLRLDIHVPFSEGGERCHEIFTRVLDVMTFASDLEIRASGCREIRSQRDTDAFVLEAWADVHAQFCPAESTGIDFKSFMYKELLCGSHINNRDLHLSETDRAWIDQPIRTGTYMGDGASSRVVNLGYRPRAVFASAIEAPAIQINSVQSWFGFAAGSFGSMGVELSASGFLVRSGPGFMAGGVLPAMNEGGRMYMFLALV